MNKYRKINGLTGKLSCEQLLSYIAGLIEVGVFYGIVSVHLTEVNTLIIVAGIYGLLFVMKLVYGAMLTLNDPSDPILITSQKGKNLQIIQRIKQNPENYQFCHHCQSHTHISSKHCKKCRRCVYGFDHHCKWINNCVSRSYHRHFIVFIVIEELQLAYFLLGAILVTPELQQWQIVVLWIFTSVVILFMVLLLILIIMSFYLISIGMKTQQWFTSKKSNKIAPIPNNHQNNSTQSNLIDPHISPVNKLRKYQKDIEIIPERVSQLDDQEGGKKQQNKGRHESHNKREYQQRRGLFPQQNQYEFCESNSFTELRKKQNKPKKTREDTQQLAHNTNQNKTSASLFCLTNFFITITTIEKGILPPKVHLKLQPSMAM